MILSHWNTRCPTEGWTTKKHTAACRNVTLEYHFCSPSSHRYWHIRYWATVVSHMGHLTWDVSRPRRVQPHPLLHPFLLFLLPGSHRAWLQAFAVNLFHSQKVQEEIVFSSKGSDSTMTSPCCLSLVLKPELSLEPLTPLAVASLSAHDIIT